MAQTTPSSNPTDEHVVIPTAPRVIDVQRGPEHDVVVTPSLSVENAGTEGDPRGPRRDMTTPHQRGIGVRREMPIRDSVPIQNSSRPSSSEVHPRAPTSAIGARLAALGPVSNMPERRTTTPTSSRIQRGPNNRSKRPHQQGTTTGRLDRRARQRQRREQATAQPFETDIVARPNTDGILDGTGQRHVRTVSSIIRPDRPRRNRRSNASSRSGSAASDDDDESIGGSTGGSGEVPGDSDYRMPRQGPISPHGDNEIAVQEGNANTSQRNLRHARR